MVRYKEHVKDIEKKIKPIGIHFNLPNHPPGEVPKARILQIKRLILRLIPV